MTQMSEEKVNKMSFDERIDIIILLENKLDSLKREEEDLQNEIDKLQGSLQN